jgi:Starch-binding associating with outer membrane
MKKIIFSIITLTFIVSSCVTDQSNINDDIKKPYQVSGQSLFTNAQKELVDQMTTPSVNLNVFRYFSQYWAATLYNAESRYSIASTTRRVPDNNWNNLYTQVLNNLKSSEELLSKELAPDGVSSSEWAKQQKNRVAIIEILRVYTYQVLVDTYGNIPYSESLQTPNNILPKYDDAGTVYASLIARLNTATSSLDSSAGSFSSDNFYKGDVSKWILFANSLKVKIGINLADVNPALSKTTVEAGYTGGVILSNSDNAGFIYDSSAPNFNPVYDNLVASGRNDFVPAKTIVDVMVASNDPRKSKYFTPLADGSFVGGKYGAQNTNSYATSYSHVGDIVKQPNSLGILMEATEVNFYLAESAARGYSVGNSASIYYNSAIQSSMDFWGVPSSDASTYIASVPYNVADWKNSIGTQAWVAYYNRGFESWTSYRRLDFPVLTAPSNAVTAAAKKVPVRFFYPADELLVNGDNVKVAGTAIGGDNLTTKIFWDKN